MSPIRRRLVALAEGYAGVDVSTARQRYLDLVAPAGVEDALRHPYFTHARTSGCALVVRGLWRLAGLEHPILAAPYRVSRAIADVVEIAREADAWIGVHEIGARRPLPGDVVLVGAPSHEHVYTVVALGHSGSIVTIDGGQINEHGQQAIERRGRSWSPGAPLIDTVAGGRARPVVGLVDVDRLPWPALPRAAGCALPGA